MRLSLCMIVRDEEQHLARCLASVEGIVDEVCIVDTGSVDGTEEVARAAGARIERRPWDDDFAAARNASLAMAQGDWILVLDADEELHTDDARAKLLRFAEHASGHAGRILVLDEEELGSCPTTRFFPRNAQPTYVGRIHEQLLLGGELPRTADTGVEVLHCGYAQTPALRSRKLARNAALLERAIAEAPQDAYLHYQLGRTWFVADELERALESFSRSLELVEAEAPFLAHLFESTGYTLRALERSQEALGLLRRVSRAFPRRADTCFLEALLSMDVGELSAAEAGFHRCLELQGTQPEGGPFSELAQKVGPAHNLGVMYEVLELKDAARQAYGQALAFDPAHAASLAGLERCSA